MSKKYSPAAGVSRRDFLGMTGALAGSTLLTGVGALGARAAERASADVILTDADIITLDPVNPRAEAIAIRDGLVQAVGRKRDVLKLEAAETEVLSVGGRTVIPGLNDSHMHPTRAGRFYALELRWDGCRRSNRD